MSNVLTQKCAVCGVYKDPQKTDISKWICLPKIMIGAARQPIEIFRALTPVQRAIPAIADNSLDFSPGCQPKTTVDKLVGLLTPKIPAPPAT